MSTIEEFKKNIIIRIKPKESLLLSISKDAVTFGFLILCIYISRVSRFWTFVSGVLFLCFLYTLFSKIIHEQCSTFRDKKSAIEYINKQDIDESQEENEIPNTKTS